MKKTEQKKIVNSLIKEVKDEIVGSSTEWPEDWDENELRTMVADRFSKERSEELADRRTVRFKSYSATMASLNL